MVRNKWGIMLALLCIAGTTFAGTTTFTSTKYGTTSDDNTREIIRNPALLVTHDLTDKLDSNCTITDATLKIWLSDDEEDEDGDGPDAEFDPEHVQIKFELNGGSWGSWLDIDEVDIATQSYTYNLDIAAIGLEDQILKYKLRVAEIEGDALIHRSKLTGNAFCSSDDVATVPIPGACLLASLGSWGIHALRRRHRL